MNKYRPTNRDELEELRTDSKFTCARPWKWLLISTNQEASDEPRRANLIIMTDYDDAKLGYVTIPKFSGDDEDWDVFWPQFLAAVGYKGVGSMLTETDPVPVDTEDLQDAAADDDMLKALKAKKRRLKRYNGMGFSMLLQSFDTRL